MGLFNNYLEVRVQELELQLERLRSSIYNDCMYPVHPTSVYNTIVHVPTYRVLNKFMEEVGYEVRAPYTQEKFRVEKVCRTTKKS